MSSPAANAAAALLNVAEIEGRGRVLVAAQPLKGGQVVLKDSPILLYSAFPFTAAAVCSSSSAAGHHRYCDHCFRALQSPSVPCPSCRNHAFCSSSCLGAASVSSHSPWACQAIARLAGSPSFVDQPPERQVQARFLIAAYNLSLTSPGDFQILLSLQWSGICSDDTASAVQFLHPLIASVCQPQLTPFPLGFSPELTANLLSRDKLNAFGLMEPFGAGGDGERSVRAYGIYPRASFFNHDCLPNACRFDYADTAPDRNTDIIVRMIHDVPQGREICLSYFPVNLNYPSRQKRLMEDYGFKCECDRCKVEANWSDNEEDDDTGVEEMEDEGDGEMKGSLDDDIKAEKDTDFPHAYFFVSYVCNRENCFGTLAPLDPTLNGAGSDIMECNVCGQLRRADDEEEEDMDE